MTKLLFSLLALSVVGLARIGEAGEAERILNDSGMKGGLVVFLDCDDPDLIASFRAGDSCVVHSLDTDPRRVESARRHLIEQDLYGPISVDSFDGTRLPYVDNLVNLIVADQLGDVPMAEVLRVLRPLGVAHIGGQTTVKPWPDNIDEWGQYLHGADNNALSRDTVAGPPRHMQWLCGPLWTRHHDTDKGTYPTIRAVVSAGGRLYYLLDETRSSNMQIPGRWALIARDGFSGVQLWKRAIQAESYPRNLDLLWRQIIADGDKVYVQMGSGQALSQLDGATGEVLQTYAGCEGFKEVIKCGDDLFFVNRDNHILSIDARSGDRRWTWNPGEHGEIVRLTLAAADGRVFVKTAGAACCLSADNGAVLWAHPLRGPEKSVLLSWPRERLIVADGVVLVSFGGKDPQVLNKDVDEFLGSHPRVREYGGRLAALDAQDGKQLWETAYLPNLESAPGEFYANDGLVWLGPDFAEARDLRTGDVRGGLAGVLERLWSDGHHHRCYPGKATTRYLLTGKRGIELFDTVGDNHSRNNWVRATCRVGVTPCNGLIYAPPHSCGCYMEAQLHGFWALAAERTAVPDNPLNDDQRLEKGPAFGTAPIRASHFTLQSSPAWPTYRGDNARSGSTTAAVPARLNPAWTVTLGGVLSAPTVADGKLFVAQVDRHTVHAIDAIAGRRLWQFTAGGRIDSPPTFFQGMLLFGSRDGYVYCLRAADGELVWRFLAAPRRISAVAFDQVESLWPVHGSILVEKGIAYVAAGRSSYVDGGIMLYALDPAAGTVLHHRSLRSDHAGTLDPPENAEQMASKIRQNWLDYKTFLAPDKSDSFAMQGALTDIMTTEADSIFLRQLRFDRMLVEQEQKRQHLFSTFSLLDSAEHHRSYWVLGTGDFNRLEVAFPWIVGSSLQVPFGMMMAFDDRTVWTVTGGAGKRRQAPDYAVTAALRPDPEADDSRLPDFQRRSESGKQGAPIWQQPLASRPRAILRAGEALFIAGMKDADYTRPLDDWQSGLVRVFSSQDGRPLNEIDLPAPPVWDGLAAANGRLYVCMENETVACLATP